MMRVFTICSSKMCNFFFQSQCTYWHQYFVAWNQITSCIKYFSIHVRETTSGFVAWIPNNHTQSAFSFLQPFNQLGLAQLRFESLHLRVGFIPLVFVGIISLLNGAISWVGLMQGRNYPQATLGCSPGSSPKTQKNIYIICKISV